MKRRDLGRRLRRAWSAFTSDPHTTLYLLGSGIVSVTVELQGAGGGGPDGGPGGYAKTTMPLKAGQTYAVGVGVGGRGGVGGGGGASTIRSSGEGFAGGGQ